VTETPAVPIFDGDNHLYEDREAFTKFLPVRYKSVIRYIEIDGRNLTRVMHLTRAA